MRAKDLRVERAAVAATELSLARCAELYAAVPVVDHGADLFAYQVEPFRVARIQVKGATGGMAVFPQYSTIPIIMSYVLDPLGAADVILLTGAQAWNLPAEYIAQGGIANGYDAEEGPGYRFPSRTRLLSSMLDGYIATPERWLELFDLTATSDGTGSALPANNTGETPEGQLHHAGDIDPGRGPRIPEFSRTEEGVIGLFIYARSMINGNALW